MEKRPLPATQLNRIATGALLVLLALSPLQLTAETPGPLLDAADHRALTDALRAIKMTERDLAFSKTNVETELLLPVARHLLQHPLDLPGQADELRQRLATVETLPALVGAASPPRSAANIVKPSSRGRAEFDETRSSANAAPTRPPGRGADAAPTGDSADAIAAHLLATARRIRPALPAPNPAAWDAFVLSFLRGERHQLDVTPATLRRDEALEQQDDELARALLDAPFDRAALDNATHALAVAVEQAIAQLRQSGATGEFQRETDSELGKIIIGGTGPNTYTHDAFLILDLGGDDVYENSAGGANGLSGRPVSIVIDLGGADRFVTTRNFSQGAGVFGIGILAALGSNATFQAQHLSQGAGFFGSGILMTGPGQHTFEANTFTQGAGMFGTGILWQGGGDTTYRCGKYGQGFGGVQGTGLLLDADGHDAYVAASQDACGWLPGHFFTLSQGFGYGMRPFAGGGVGILCDLKGNDRYTADVYGQGASYWYALGLLLDADGDDTYAAHQYCQGTGIHLSVGGLFDWAGNDTYTAGHICQGAAHDYSVGLLIDRTGNDAYTGKTTAQGAAINNSFALLLDRAGDDTYTGVDPKQSQATGHSGDKREYGSIASLLDLAGHDTYSQGQSNNAAWIKPFYGAGIDAEAGAASSPRPTSPPPLPSLFTESQPGRRLYGTAPVDPDHPIERQFRIATSDRPEAGKAWDDLKANAADSLAYVITRFDTPNVMLRVKAEELVDHLNTNAIPILITGIRTAKNDEVARLCCYFLARFDEKARAAIPAVLPLLNRPATRPVAFYTLGHLRAREAFPHAMRAVDESRELVRLRATQCLGRIGNPRAIPRLIGKLDDAMYNVRYAAQDALIAFGPPALDPVREAYRRATPRARAHLLEIMAKLGDATALDRAREFYRDDNSLVREAVLTALTDALKQARSVPLAAPAGSAGK